ncbi:ribbon-helix-helix protein, CopG family [Microbacterium sp.]|uniref:ribbon-helix-helix protein, CopG family n=1 Tax=Microbacterium sp. TaxID=51671 RepID=UPI003A8D31BA
MAMNLRLQPEAAAALRAESERTGLSQQEILRRAVDEHLGLGAERPRPRAWPEWVEPPAEPMREPRVLLHFPPGRSSTDVLDELREERL